jgi:hypothetical protein
MDAATAAAMSDPERNPLFRRRWQEQLSEPVLPWPEEPDDDMEPTSHALLLRWRQAWVQRERGE